MIRNLAKCLCLAMTAIAAGLVYADAVSTARLGSLHPKNGVVVTNVDFTTSNTQLVATIEAKSPTKVSELENDAGYISADTNRIVIGRNHETSADTDIICIGGTCKSTATNSTAIGFGAFAVGDYSTAIGGSDANGVWNTSIGVNNQTFYGYSSAFGVENYIYGGLSTALGVLNQIYGNYTFSAGLQNSITNVQFVTVLGYDNNVEGSSYSTLVGRGNKAEVSSSAGSTLVGSGNEAKGGFSTIVGSSSKANGSSSTAIGSMAEAIGYEAIAIGQSVTASNSWSVAIGQSAIATNNNAIVIGSSGTFLDRPRSHGNSTITLGHSSVDETKVYIGDRKLADIIDSRVGDVESVVTNIVRDLSLGGIWDAELQVWWTPRMRNGSLTYEATTNVNLNAGN